MPSNSNPPPDKEAHPTERSTSRLKTGGTHSGAMPPSYQSLESYLSQTWLMIHRGSRREGKWKRPYRLSCAAVHPLSMPTLI
ncbi:hypothetical protein E2P81_ATG07285 [Venturia nashicola]|nr:hypothetical protein E2P81_ATG07285 [Venturia nashicola]